MALIGAILGDISGSQYEFDRAMDADNCLLFSDDCMYTDDTVMSLAVKLALDKGIPFDVAMRELGRQYPLAGYGGRFEKWIFTDDSKPYNSWGNGSAMRVSYVADYYDNLNDIIKAAEDSAKVSHNHPEGIKGAIVTAKCIWMAKNKKSKQDIYDYVLSEYPNDEYEYPISLDMNYLQKHYVWNESCQGSVPVAMRCFIESNSYESFLRNVFSLDCDADTLAAIGGAVAEEYYGTTGLDVDQILNRFLDKRLLTILNQEM